MDSPQTEENTEEQPPGTRLENSLPTTIIKPQRIVQIDEKAVSLGSISEKITLEIICDIARAEQLWRQWSKNQSLFDTWEFRYAFYQGYQYQPHFILIKLNRKVIGMLPLWYENDLSKYAWFGSWWQEDNSIFTISPKYIPEILSVCPPATELNAILPTEVNQNHQYLFKEDLPKYVLSLESISSSNDFLQTLKKKKRYNVKRDCRIIQEQNPQIIINRFNDFDELVRLSKQRFEQKNDEADWIDPRRVETFRQVIKLGQTNKSYEIRMITVEIGSKIASVDLIAIYKHTYYAIKCGYDVAKFPGIGNYVNILEIEDAIKLKCHKMDFLEIGYGWKDGWFTSVPLLTFSK